MSYFETKYTVGECPKRIYISSGSRGGGKTEMMKQLLEGHPSLTTFSPWSYKLPDDEVKYAEADTDLMIHYYKEMYSRMLDKKIESLSPRLRIKKLIFDYPATIVYWYDDTKTVVKCREGETFDLETGLAMAICKKQIGDKYKSQFRKWIKNAVIKNKAPEVSNTDKLNKALNDVLDDIDNKAAETASHNEPDPMGSGAVNTNDKYSDGGF